MFFFTYLISCTREIARSTIRQYALLCHLFICRPIKTSFRFSFLFQLSKYYIITIIAVYNCSPYLRRRRRHASSSADASSAPHIIIIYDTRQSCCCCCCCCCSCCRSCRRRRRRHTTAGRHYQRNDKCASAVRPFAGDNDIIINDIDLSSVPRLTLSFYIF